MKRYGLIVLTILFYVADGTTQVVDLFRADSSRIYFEITLKEKYNNRFLYTNHQLFNDSVSFYSFLDSASQDKVKPVINFKDCQVIMESYCRQCFLHCHHERYAHNVCHRNSCSYSMIFYQQRRNTREDVNYKRLWVSRDVFTRDSLFASKEEWKALFNSSDSIQKVDFEKEIVLFRIAGGDCHARFRHEVFLDHTRKKLVWKLYNIYGGCRAGKSEDFFISVPKLPEGYQIQLEQILVD